MRGTLPFAEPAVPGAPTSVDELVHCGGISRLERQAANRAIDFERRFWLPVLEAWRDRCKGGDDPYSEAYLTGEIRRLRRLTGVPSLERRRAQVRKRVRRWRARHPGKKDIDGGAAPR